MQLDTALGERGAPTALWAATDDHLSKLLGPFLLSCGLAFVFLGVLFAFIDTWKFLAFTRVLDLLIEGGIIQYHDRNPGFIAGIPDPKLYYLSQDPIDWRLIFVSGLLMMVYPLLKAVQFDRIAAAFGSTASLGSHVRAYLYGDGLDRVLPFNMGRVGMANALASVGLSRERAGGVVVVSQIFTLLEICAFALLGLALLGWSRWLGQLVYPIAVLALAYHLVARSGRMSAVPPLKDVGRTARATFLALGRARPGLLVGLGLLSLFAFATIDVAVYSVMMALDTEVVLLNVEPSLLLMAIVGGYIAARLVPVTPGGIGQWELGFATALFIGEADVSLPLLCIGLIAGLVRTLTGLLLMAGAMGERVPVRLSSVFSVFARADEPREARDEPRRRALRSLEAVDPGEPEAPRRSLRDGEAPR